MEKLFCNHCGEHTHHYYPKGYSRIHCLKCGHPHIETRHDIEKHSKPIEAHLKRIAGF